MGVSTPSLITTLIILFCLCGYFKFGSSSTLSGNSEITSKGFTRLFDAGDDFQSVPNDDQHAVRKRSTGKEPVKSNITSKVTELNDSHQQLMVHWAGEGSDVIICLAKDPVTPSRSDQARPSAVYISYNYGETYINKTEFFRFKSDGNVFASIDKFFNHPKFNTHIVFLDKTHKMVFTTSNSGKNFQQHSLAFNPIDVTFHPENPSTFLIHDDKHSLWATSDFGVSWSRTQELVKSFYWVSDDGGDHYLIVLREEPTTSSVIAVKGLKPEESASLSLVIRDVVDCWVKGEFIFVTQKDPKDSQNLDLLISHKRGEFKRAVFQSELRRQAYHIVDADSGARVMVAVSHSEYLASLYVSELLTAPGDIKFSISLERVFCYVQDKMWTDSWLSDVADTTFADVHKVEGLKGVYIASQVLDSVGINPGVEHLRSVITWDWGGEWRPLAAPHYSAEFHPLNCNLTNNCSLHLSQKFAQLYPVTRATPIMSSKSAPGLILAMGTLGSSLKGHVGLYMSQDAGLTWHQLLEEYYLFNFGDHGGVLVAVKYFKSHGETDVLKYSTDEGESWHDHVFTDEDLRIYGLMTEPGENTTVFTMFGSAHSHHQWLIIKVDLRNAFAYNCSKDDYKLWTPGSGAEGTKMSCLLGLRETYERRVPHSNCYNGIDYDRPVHIEVCPCDAEDFECDFGFERAVGMSQCIRNKSLDHEPYAPPSWCRPGLFYNRTKGYLKIQGDACEGGLERSFLPDTLPCPYDERKEFLLMAQKDRIVRWDLATLELEELPVRGLQSVVAVEFDIHNNCVYWADIITDTIARQCLGSNSNGTVQLLVEKDVSSVEGLALDWMTNMLYFVDGIKARIQVVRTDINHAGRMRHTVVGPNVLKKPRGIAVHPAAGYLYWTDWAVRDPCVSRSNLDGTGVKRLFSKPDVEWPNGITIDFIAERIYFVDAREDFIGSADLDGKHFRKIIHNKEQVSHPFAVAVFKDLMYWDDWKQNSLYSSDKDHGVSIQAIESNLPGLMDLKVYAHSLQEGKNQCSDNKKCSHLCFVRADNTSVCLCPDAMEQYNGQCFCPGRVKPYANDTCPEDKNNKCTEDQFKCKNNLCISKLWHCDGDNDCGDFSDEMNCGSMTCQPDQFQCVSSGKCISPKWRCDYEKDCEDGSDEVNCTYVSCTSEQFQCANKLCISRRWVCDMEDDCRDGSDEANCTTTPSTLLPSTCSGDYFMCKNPPHLCIPHNWRCDGETDCPDSSDEKACETATCESWQFQCKNKRCIFKAWRCDGDYDCGENDLSDEENCTSIRPTVVPTRPDLPTNSCMDWMFQCANKKCVPYWWKCDAVNDCGDNSDEIGCGVLPATGAPGLPPAVPTSSGVCQSHQFRCINGDCIQDSWVCDGNWDCDHGEDEAHCEQAAKCNEFRCSHDGSCIPLRQVCDGIVQCPDRSDEMSCSPTVPQVLPGPSCQEGMFPCDNNRCLPLSLMCNGHTDCVDESDETNCDKTSKVYQVLRFGVETSATNATSVKLFWWLPSSPSNQFQFLPAYKVATSPTAPWINTSWIVQADYLYTNLKPYTAYNLTVYVRNISSQEVFPPAKFVTALTKEAEPEAPWNVSVKQLGMTQALVSWLPPHQSNGPLTGYTVCMTPPIPPLCKTVHASKTQALIESDFNVHQNFSFWVKAKNTLYESDHSAVVKLVGDDAADLEAVSDLVVKLRNNDSVSLAWRAPSNAGTWRVLPRALGPSLFPRLPAVLTNTHTCTVSNLAPGTDYIFEVVPYHKEFEGRSASVSARTIGEPLRVVTSVISEVVKSEGTAVRLGWDPVSDGRRPAGGWEYGVYYGVTLNQLLLKGAVLKTKKTTATVEGLAACQSYVFAVGLVGPLGMGPLSPRPQPIMTQFNPAAPPTDLHVLPDTHNDTVMSITWSASCPVVSKNISYEITVTEVSKALSASVTVGPSPHQDLQHSLVIEHGGRYNVCVSAAVPGASPGPCKVYYAPPLPVPSQLELLEETNGSHVLYWRPPQLPSEAAAHKYHYVVLMSPGSSLNTSSHQLKQFTVQNPPFIVTPPDDNLYSYAILFESESGYRSEASEVVSLASTKGTWASQHGVASYLLPSLLVVAIICCALFVALGFVFFRHRRLQHTFSQFANSHFSTRSGTATFTGSDELDDEDSPVIRGFSDDEPLVIA